MKRKDKKGTTKYLITLKINEKVDISSLVDRRMTKGD